MSANKMIKIGHFVFSLNPGGVESFLRQLTENLPSKEIKSYFFCFCDGALREQLEQAGATIVFLGSPYNPLTWIRYGQLIKKMGIQIVHCHCLIYALVVGIICKINHIPFLLYSHHSKPISRNHRLYYFFERTSLTLALHLAAAGFGVSEQACIYLGGKDYKNNKVQFFALGLDISRFRPDSNHLTKSKLQSEFHITDKTIVIANVAGYRQEKNYPFFIEVASLLLKKRSDIVFLLIGEGSKRQRIEKLISDKGIGDKCVLTGFRNDVPEILSKLCHIFLFPSIYEGLGLSLIEAQAAGLISFFSDHLPKEVFINSDILHPLPLKNGPDCWADEIDRAITKLQDNPIDRLSAYHKVLNSQFNIEDTAKRFTSICKQFTKTNI